MSDDLKKQETILTNNQEKDQDASNESLKKDTIWSKIPLIFSVISIVLYSVGWLYTRAYFRAFSIDESSLGFSALYYITSGIWGIIASFMTIFALILLGFFTHDEPNEDTKKEAELKYPKLTRFFNRINIPFEKYSQFSDKYIPLNGIIACFLVGIALPYILIQATNVIEDGSKMFYLCCTAYFPLLVWCAVKIKTTINKEKYIENLRSKLNGWFALYFFVFYVAFSASVIGTAEGMFAYGGDSLPKIELKIKVSSSTKNDNKILGNLIIHRNGNYYILVRKDKDTDSIYAFPSLLIVPDSNVESAKTDMGKYVFGLKRVSDFGVKHFMPREESNMFFLRATVYDKEGAYDKAIADYSKAIELDPKFGVAYYRRGVNYHNKDEWAKAIQDFNKAQELFPFDTEVYYKRGLSYEKKGNFDEAKFNYTVVIELDPKNAQAYYSRAGLYHNKSEYEKAINDYTKTIELESEISGAYFNRGSCYFNKGDYEKAIYDYSKAIELGWKDSKSYCNRGACYLNKLEYNKAIDDLNVAIELDKKYSLAYTNRGITYLNQEKLEQAIEDFKKSLELNPNDSNATNLLKQSQDKLNFKKK